MRSKTYGAIAGMVVLCASLSIPAFAQSKTVEKKTQTGARSRTMREIDYSWKRAKNWSLAYVDAMPEDAINFKPTPEIRSFAEQMLHLAYWNCGLVEPAAGKPNPFGKDEIEKKGDYKTKAALRKAVEQSYDYVIAAVAELDETRLADEITFFNSKVTRLMALSVAADHQSHHRGQATIYLRLKGVTPPPEP